MATAPAHGWKTFRWKLCLLAAAILIALLGAEIALRIAGFSYPRMMGNDPVLGFIHRPGLSYWYREEGESYVEHNDEGFRDVQWPVERSEGEFRIAVLGDSFVEAVQVPRENRVTEWIEQNLGKRDAFAERKVRVMNFGMSGYGTGQELLVLRERVAKYKPDLVVLAVLTGNDFRDNSKALRPHAMRPFFYLEGEELKLDDSYLRSIESQNRWNIVLFNKLWDSSKLVQLAMKARKDTHVRAETAAEHAALGEVGLDAQMYAPPPNKAWEEAWRLTERLLLEVDKECQKQQVKLLVAVLDNPDQVELDLKKRQVLQDKLKVADLFYADRRIEQFCREKNIPVLTLAQSFQKYADEHQEHLHGFENTSLGSGHWNENGHRLAGEMIAEAIAALQRGDAPTAPPVGQDAPREAAEVAP